MTQEFSSFIENPNFCNVFAIILDRLNLSPLIKLSSYEFLEYITKLCKVNIEGQLKIIVSLNFSNNELFKVDAPKLLQLKSKEIKDYDKNFNLSIDVLQNLIFICMQNNNENSELLELFQNSLNKLMFSNFNNDNNQLSKSKNQKITMKMIMILVIRF